MSNLKLTVLILPALMKLELEKFEEDKEKGFKVVELKGATR